MFSTLKKMAATDMDRKELLDSMQGAASAIRSLENKVSLITFENFANALGEYESARNVNRVTSNYTLEVHQCKSVLDVKWKALMRYFDYVELGFVDDEVKKVVKEVKLIVKQFGNPLYASYERKSAIIYNVTEVVGQLDSKTQETSGIKPYLDALNTARVAFKDAIDSRLMFKKNLDVSLSHTTRCTLIKAYTALCREIEFLLQISPNDSLVVLVRKLNTIATEINAKIQSRKTLALNISKS